MATLCISSLCSMSWVAAGCSMLQYSRTSMFSSCSWFGWLVVPFLRWFVRFQSDSLSIPCVGTLVLESHSVTEFGELRAFLGQNLTLLSHFLCILDQSSKSCSRLDDTQDVKPNQDSPCYTNKYIKDETHTHPFQSEYHTCHNFLVSVSMLEL